MYEFSYKTVGLKSGNQGLHSWVLKCAATSFVQDYLDRMKVLRLAELSLRLGLKDT
jgi:hypothetical protein